MLRIRFEAERFYKDYSRYGSDGSDDYCNDSSDGDVHFEPIRLEKSKMIKKKKKGVLRKIAFYSKACYGLADEVFLCTGKD